MAHGGKKDAKYVYSQFLPFIKDFEKRKPNTVDLVLFDGASNVQKAGDLLASSYPRICVLHGAEHVMSLFFNDVFKYKELRSFIKICRIFYKVFGSGAMHAPYASFQKHAKNHNDGRKIGLIRASDTRMGGHVIALMRLLRLRAAIKNTVVSVEMRSHKVCNFVCVVTHKSKSNFLTTNLQVAKHIEALALHERMWQDMLTVVRALFPGLIVLRLADSNSPNMDKLYYYVRRLDRVLAQSKVLLDRVQQSISDNTVPGYTQLISDCMLNRDFDMEHDDNNESEVDYSTSSDNENQVLPTLGDCFMCCWDHRKLKLTHDLSISGWMVSPIPEIFSDARTFSNGKDHREAVERLFLKWFEHESDGNSDTLRKMLNTFWDEYELFISRQGNFKKDYYWTSEDLVFGKSYQWHKKYSVPYTVWFGRFACRVTSKILGIGSAERNWGEVKHLKTDKHSHLSADRVKNRQPFLELTVQAVHG